MRREADPSTTVAAALTPALQVRGLSVAYRNRVALRDIDLTIAPGRLVAIVGPNGAGKSTLLRAALGLVAPMRGSIQLLGEPLGRQRDRIAYVPQREAVDWDFPVSALEVVTMGLYRRIGWLRPVRQRHRDAARGAMVRLGIGELADRQISQLSGGQQQRVFLARALVQDASLLLMDEPLAGVDAATEEVVLDLLTALRREGRSIIVIHHNLDVVRERFDDAVLLNETLVAHGPVAEVLVESHLRSAYGGRLREHVAASVPPGSPTRP